MAQHRVYVLRKIDEGMSAFDVLSSNSSVKGLEDFFASEKRAENPPIHADLEFVLEQRVGDNRKRRVGKVSRQERLE